MWDRQFDSGIINSIHYRGVSSENCWHIATKSVHVVVMSPLSPGIYFEGSLVDFHDPKQEHIMLSQLRRITKERTQECFT